MKTPKQPKDYNTINPFIITEDVRKYIEFVVKVFGGKERKEGFTVDTDGLVLHAEIEVGDSVILCAETKKNWPYTPGFIQAYVENVEMTLKKAESLGLTIVTKPTIFYGDIFSRMLDPFGNLWWVYQHNEAVDWGSDESSNDSDDAAWDGESKELTYIHETIMDIMPKLGKNK